MPGLGVCPHCSSAKIYLARSFLHHAVRMALGSRRRYCRQCGFKWSVDERAGWPKLYVAAALIAAASLALLSRFVAFPGRAPAGCTAYIGALEGSAEARSPGSQAWHPAKRGMVLRDGTSLRTGAGGSATIAFTDGSTVRLGPNSNFTAETTAASNISVYLGLGTLDAWISKVPGRKFEVRNPVAVASVRGTVFSIHVESAQRATLSVFEGSVVETDTYGRTQLVESGFHVAVKAETGAADVAPLPRHAEPPPPPPPPAMMAPPPPPDPRQAGGFNPSATDAVQIYMDRRADGSNSAGAGAPAIYQEPNSSPSSIITDISLVLKTAVGPVFGGVDRKQAEQDLERLSKQQLWDKYGHHFQSKEQAKQAYEQYQQKKGQGGGAPPP